MSAKRSILRIELDPGTKNRLEDMCSRRGMTQITLMSRIVNWFSGQDDHIQTAVLRSQLEGSNQALTKSLLQKLSSREKEAFKRPYYLEP